MDIGTLTGQIAIEDQLTGVMGYASNVIKTFTSELGSMIGLSGPAGIALAGVGAVAVGVAGAIAGITTAIISLGNRGSDVNDVAATFEHFSGSVETAHDSLKQMQEGTKGTVTNFDLMKSASKLLAADVSLTSDQFGTLSKAAFVLQNQGLGPTKDMLELVSQALLTGRKRSLEMKIGKIDLTKATYDYAKSLGKSREDLTELQKTEAARIGILEALNKKVQEAGEQQRDFGETMDAAVVFIKNWGDALSQRVADSPKVMAAVHNIESAIKQAFGSETQSVMDIVLEGIEKFADVASVQGPIIIKFMADAIQKTKEWLEWLEKVQKIFQFMTPQTSGTVAVEGMTGAFKKGQAGVKGLLGGLMTSQMATAYGQSGDGSFTFEPPTTFNANVKKVKTALDDLGETKKKQDAIDKKIFAGMKDYASMLDRTDGLLWKTTQDLQKYIAGKREEEYLISRTLPDMYNWVETLEHQRATMARMIPNLEGMNAGLADQQRFTHNIIEQARKNIVEERWDKVGKAMHYAGQIAAALPGKFGEIASAAVEAADNIIRGFAEGGVVGGIVAGVAEGIKAITKLLGPTDYEKRVRAAAAEMKTLTAEAVKSAGSMERLALNAQMVGIYIKGAFDSGDPKFLNQILDEMQDKTQKLTAAMQEYGFTWEDLGADYRGAQLADQFDVLFEKTQLLKGAGIDYSTILQRQAGDYSALVQAAIRSGTEIPISMQPVLQDLLNMGKLVDANGVAFDDLSDISWAKSMTQGFEDVTTAIYDLRDALVGGVGAALDDIGRRVVRPRIEPDWDYRGGELEEAEPSYFAHGGTVVPFRPRGSDTVPAMLTPGERVIPRGGGGGGTVVVELNGRWVAEAVAPELPGVIKRLGIR